MKTLPMLIAAFALAGCGGTATSIEPASPKPDALAEKQVPTPALQASYERTKGEFEGDKSAEKEKAYIAATVAYATAVMAGGGEPSEIYPKALQLYDEALALDPANDEAKANKQLILDIYASLGKEPPK